MRRLVTLDTAGLGDDLLHVLDLALTAGECAELEILLVIVQVCMWNLELAFV